MTSAEALRVFVKAKLEFESFVNVTSWQKHNDYYQMYEAVFIPDTDASVYR